MIEPTYSGKTDKNMAFEGLKINIILIGSNYNWI